MDDFSQHAAKPIVDGEKWLSKFDLRFYFVESLPFFSDANQVGLHCCSQSVGMGSSVHDLILRNGILARLAS